MASQSALRLADMARRGIDIVLASLCLLTFLPVMLVVAVCIYAEDGGPVFFQQPRVGRDGRNFTCIKFRSMVVNSDAIMLQLMTWDRDARAEYARNRKLRKDPRVTVVGRWIRRRSLDELPQLLNVVRGDMSLVGPRPILLGEKTAYGYRLAQYHTVRPGITGLWQVRGRSNATFRSRIAMDMVYIKARSPLFDLAILLSTIPAVFLGKGSY